MKQQQCILFFDSFTAPELSSIVELDLEVQRYVFKHASGLLLVNSFNDPSQMLFPLLLNSKFSHLPHLRR